MSAGGAFGGARGYQPRAPEKGVFPLDHFGECKKIKEEYLQCLKGHGNDAEPCREVAKAYLQCRMERNLMAEQDLRELGFPEGNAAAAAATAAGAAAASQELKGEKRRKESEGYVAGMRRFDKE